MGVGSVLVAMADGADADVETLEAAEGLLHLAQVLVGAHGVLG